MIEDTDPFTISEDKLMLSQTSFNRECDQGFNEIERDDFSDGQGLQLVFDGQDAPTLGFTLDYDIPEGDVLIALRSENLTTNTSPADFVLVRIFLDGNEVNDFFPSDSLGWDTINLPSPGLSAGSHTLRLELGVVGDPNENLQVDIFGLLDNRFTYNFDNEVHEPKGYLDGPELKPPEGAFIESNETLADTNITSARLNTTFNDHTKGNQALQLSFDQGETYLPVDGTEESTDSIEADAATTGLTVQGRARMSAFPLDANDGNPQNATPRFGYDGHEIDTWTIDVDTDNIEVLFDQEFNDNRLATISNIADSSSQFFRWEDDVCRIFTQGEETNVELKEENITSTTDIEDTYSSVQVIGRGDVESDVIESDDAPEYVDRHKEIRDRDIESEQDARRRALEFIEDNGTIIFEGDIDTLPTRAPLGELMDGELFSHGTDMFIERVNYSKRSASISLGRRRDFGKEIMQLERSKRSSEILDTS